MMQHFIKPFLMNGNLPSSEQEGFIPVDDWIPSKEDEIFIACKGSLLAPLSTVLGLTQIGEQVNYPYMGNMDDDEIAKINQLNTFVLASKRCYNGVRMREHLPKYLNYFEKFYDTDRELLMIMAQIKMNIDFVPSYTETVFVHDLQRFFFSPSIFNKIIAMNEDNYILNLDDKNYKNDKNMALVYRDRHAKVLMWMSVFMNVSIPLITHFIYIKKLPDANSFILKIFDIILNMSEINIYNKLDETSISNVMKNYQKNEKLWAKQDIRGKTPTIHAIDSVTNIILNIMPKYVYNQNIIFFNYTSIKKNAHYQVTGIEYEYDYIPLSSSTRDADNNSIFDKFESYLTKQSESLYLQNKCACESTMSEIDLKYGPFDEDEINYYITRLEEDGGNVINEFQKSLIFYLFYKDFGDPQTINSINRIDYVKLMIAATKILKVYNMVILPYVISSKIDKLQNKKAINKKEQLRFKSAPYYNAVHEKYKSEKLELYILGIIATIMSSKFKMIDYDDPRVDGNYLDKDRVSDLICEEVLMYVMLI